jgi:hypothetical protein
VESIAIMAGMAIFAAMANIASKTITDLGRFTIHFKNALFSGFANGRRESD